MLKRRIIPIELLSDGRLVKTRRFADARDVGDPVQSSKVYSDQDADELMLIQIDRRARKIDVLVDVVSSVAENCFVPLTAGGGISRTEDASRLFEAGADKVVLNSAVFRDPELVSEIAEIFGRQAIVVSIDVIVDGGNYTLYSDCGRRREFVSLEQHVATAIAAGAGELMIQSIDRDGVMEGYDLELLRRVIHESSVPIIAASGAGNFLHLKQAIDIGADAVACGSLFNFGDNNPLRARAFLKNFGIPLKRV